MDDSARAALAECLSAYSRGERPERDAERRAVKATLASLREAVPGASVEVRVPPYAAVQILEGARHRRGTPPAVVETSAQTWLLLAAGELAWGEAISAGAVHASGERSDLSALLPLNSI